MRGRLELGWFGALTLCFRIVVVFDSSRCKGWEVCSILLRVSDLVFVSARAFGYGGGWTLIYPSACCALIGQFEFKCYIDWSSRSLALASIHHTVIPLRARQER